MTDFEQKVQAKAEIYAEKLRVRLQKQAEARAKLAESKAAEKAEKLRAKLEARANRKVQNGVVEPLPGSKAAELWELFDEADCDDFKDIKETIEATGFNVTTARSRFSEWKYFHGRVKV